MSDFKAKIESQVHRLAIHNTGNQAKRPVERSGQLQKVLVVGARKPARRFLNSLQELGIPSVALVAREELDASWHASANERLVSEGRCDPVAVMAAVRLSRANGVCIADSSLAGSLHFSKAVQNLNAAYRGEDPVGDVIYLGANAETLESLFDRNGVEQLAINNKLPLFAAGSSWGSMADTMHLEVQLFNGMAIDIQRCLRDKLKTRFINESGHLSLSHHLTLQLLAAAEQLARLTGANLSGLVSFELFFDAQEQKLHFLRAQWGRASIATEQVLNIDLTKFQLMFFDGNEAEISINRVLKSRFNEVGHALECSICCEPSSQMQMIRTLDLPTGNGIRCDFAFRRGDVIPRPQRGVQIGTVTASGENRKEALRRLERALMELSVDGVRTNIYALLSAMRSSKFVASDYKLLTRAMQPRRKFGFMHLNGLPPRIGYTKQRIEELLP